MSGGVSQPEERSCTRTALLLLILRLTDRHMTSSLLLTAVELCLSVTCFPKKTSLIWSLKKEIIWHFCISGWLVSESVFFVNFWMYIQLNDVMLNTSITLFSYQPKWSLTIVGFFFVCFFLKLPAIFIYASKSGFCLWRSSWQTNVWVS